MECQPFSRHSSIYPFLFALYAVDKEEHSYLW